MDIIEIMRKRHSVRSFRSLEIGSAAADILDGYIDGINKEYGVSLRLVTGEPKAFGGFISRAGTLRMSAAILSLPLLRIRSSRQATAESLLCLKQQSLA